ncbi:TPA: hypothetical protein HA235_00890 [Candidatus Woesearchaeota archaeon]|nr:hypothetical protein [Candidatus Woesearchaeota archaeon]HIH31241.1 hypothetical protein [Candidatus Woesearchaeota archaeon]HIH54871.1 hypothetical protein [Candidatus Woesearchaeota archaeon]HIJ02032.1 hypothetical protein [Candidatus Woesearchaeota archaeon]HIJ13293.1 hypothetical protein [Candidatus Woesearchaeota archaeon]
MTLKEQVEEEITGSAPIIEEFSLLKTMRSYVNSGSQELLKIILNTKENDEMIEFKAREFLYKKMINQLQYKAMSFDKDPSIINEQEDHEGFPIIDYKSTPEQMMNQYSLWINLREDAEDMMKDFLESSGLLKDTKEKETQ